MCWSKTELRVEQFLFLGGVVVLLHHAGLHLHPPPPDGCGLLAFQLADEAATHQAV